MNFEVLPSELLLRVLSYLDAADLARISRLSRFWHILAEDGLLWKRLFHHHFPLTVLRRSLLPSTNTTTRSWKSLYKISIRWRTLKAKTSSISLSSCSTGPNTLLQHSGGVIFTASRKFVKDQAETSRICVWVVKGERHHDHQLQFLGYISLDRRKEDEEMSSLQIDSLNMEKSASTLVGAFYTSGNFSLHSVTLDQTEKSVTSTSIFHHKSLLNSPITQVAFYSPLLVTLFATGKINFWTIDHHHTDGPPKVSPCVESALVAPGLEMPCVLSLVPSKDPSSFNLSLAYTMPAYPPLPESAYAMTACSVVAVQSFTVQVTKQKDAKFTVRIDRDHSNFSVSTPAPIIYSSSPVDSSPSMKRNRRRKKRKREEISSDAEDEDRQRVPPQPSPPLSYQMTTPTLETGVTSITFSPPHVLTSHSSNAVRSYLVPSSSSSGIIPHTSVSYLPSPLLSLSSSTEMEKCVSGGKDGKIRVWDLGREGTGMVLEEEEGDGVRGKIVQVGFDEDRIVCITLDELGRESLKVYIFE